MFYESVPGGFEQQYDLVVDAVFGYSFKPPVRGVFVDVVQVGFFCWVDWL